MYTAVILKIGSVKRVYSRVFESFMLSDYRVAFEVSKALVPREIESIMPIIPFNARKPDDNGFYRMIMDDNG